MEKNEEIVSEIQQVVVFDLVKEQFGIDIQSVQEIIRMQDITKVPKTQDFVEGVISLRGRVIPIIDLRKRFGLEVTDHSVETRIIVVEIADMIIGMIVDAVSHVLRIPSSSIEPPSPIVASIDTDFIKGVGKLEDNLIIIMDIEKVLTSHEVDHLSTIHESHNKEKLDAEGDNAETETIESEEK